VVVHTITAPAPLALTNVARFCAILLAGIFAVTAGSRAEAAQNKLMLFAERAPLPVIVARGTEMAAAEQAAEAQHGCFAVEGAGESMEPVYLPGTALVVRVGGYSQLQPGKAVVYKNSRGTVVAHMVLEQKAGGWVAVGLNNDWKDYELVTESNFVGVITQAFAAKTGSLPEAVATRIALNRHLRSGQQVASAGM
jgi:hypothetical protein